MTPKAPFPRAHQKLAPISSLDELLVLPVPIAEPVKRSVWMDCLNDLTFLLPTFGIVFGLLLLLNQSPFLGAAAVTLCPIILAVRIRLALKSRRERRQVSELVNWHQRRPKTLPLRRAELSRPHQQVRERETEGKRGKETAIAFTHFRSLNLSFTPSASFSLLQCARSIPR